MERLQTVVIGAGQAGLATSYYLTKAGHDHVVLEKNRLASAWRGERWDSFTLVTPNWTLRLPEMEYSGDDPDGFLSREEVVGYLEDFAARFDPPLRESVEVTKVDSSSESNELIVNSSDSGYAAENVVVATGTFQRPNFPDYHRRIADGVDQMHSSEYRNPEQVRGGAVLVVGSGQSGCQIADELWESGREVYLATGRAGRIPRRYRGQDISYWLEKMGFFGQTVDQLDAPADRFRPNPHVSGKDGGKTLNLHSFFREGVTLLGHLRGADGFGLQVAPDLHENLAAADRFAREIKQGVDKFILESGLQAPQDDTPELRDGYQAPLITELHLAARGINTIIWATGYSFDFSWVRFPILDEFGYPVQERGVTAQPGLYFVGLHWLHTPGSGLLSGVATDAAHVTAHIENRG